MLLPQRHSAFLPAAVGLPLVAVLLSACLFGNSPKKLNEKIESGKAAEALSTLEEQLTDDTTNPALNLLAIKARLALCAERNCAAASTSGTLPPLLIGLPKLAAHVTGPVTLAEDVSPITLPATLLKARERFETLPSQPAPVIALYSAVPAAQQPLMASGLFHPALNQARAGQPTQAARLLSGVTQTDSLPTTYTYAAAMLGAMFSNLPEARETNLIALRSTTRPPLPAGAAALLPWALLTEAKTTSQTTPAEVLATLPQRLGALKAPAVLTPEAVGAIARELVAIAANPTALNQWQGGWPGSPQTLQLALQRTALNLDPNQPDLWATYLPALIKAATTSNSTTLPTLGLEGAMPSLGLSTTTVASATAPRVAGQLVRAAQQLVNYPGVAAPLVTFTSRIPLTKQQQIDLEKLSQTLLIKAAEQGDVTSTLAIARTLPGVAQNNRQSVVPLLVKYIRNNLREGNFTAATNTADLLTSTLQMDVEFAPLVLEEFADDLKRHKVQEELNADTPDLLLQPADDVILDLGPLFGFMQQYFESDPKVITAQLTTLIANAGGTYGRPTAMHRLGAYFPANAMTPEKQEEWLTASLEQALLADTRLSGAQLAETSAQLAQAHPTLNLAPLLETAIRRTPTLEDQRTLWQTATPQVREVLRAIRPEFTLLMQGIDAISENRFDAAAQAFASLTDPRWRTSAKPFIEQFNEKLVNLSGIYVPVSAAPALKTAAILLAPSGLTGGRLNTVSVTFISRVGTLAEAETATLRTNAAATHRFSMPVVYNFDARTLAITPNAVAQAPQGGSFGSTYGSIRTLKLMGDDDAGTPMLNVTLADGTTTPFIRTVQDTSQPLKPDGTYLLQTRLSQPVSTTQGILPPGSLLTLATEDSLKRPAAEDDTKSAYVVPLTGTLRHPASTTPIEFTGFFEPDLLTTTFIINYPLPRSAQPARAAVRCQALAGPITCGAHNLNSARQAYAALITGLQTRESLAEASALRTSANILSARSMLRAAVPVIPSPTTSVSGSTVSGSLVSGTLISGTLVSSTSVSSTDISATLTPSTPMPSAKATSLLPPPNMESEEDLSAEPEAPAPVTPNATSSTEPEPGAFINNSGSLGKGGSYAAPSSSVPAGVFINNSGGKANTVSPSPTTVSSTAP